MTEGNEFQQSGHAAYADGQRVPVESSRDDEESLQAYCQEFAVNMETAIEQQAFWERKLSTTTPTNASDAISFYQKVKTGLAVMVGYPGDRVMAEHCFAYVLGFKDIAGAKDAAGLARYLSTPRRTIKKQVVNKCILKYQALMGVNLQEGQRGNAARRNMSTARIDQLKQ